MIRGRLLPYGCKRSEAERVALRPDSAAGLGVSSGLRDGPAAARGTYRGQDLRLRDDAVGQAVLSALRRHLRPRHLEARPGLVDAGRGHLPRKVAGDVPVLDGEGRGEVLRLGQHLGDGVACVV